MNKKWIIGGCAALLLLFSCKQEQDTRYFAPAVSFGSESYAVSPQEGGLDVDLVLSRPATQDLTVGLVITSSLEEGLQYHAPASSVNIAAGQQGATLHFSLVDDEIWVESAWIEVLLVPGERYTVNLNQPSSARVQVNKTINMPVFRLVPPEDGLTANPYLAPALRFTLSGDRVAPSDLDIVLDFGEMVLDQDYRIAGSTTAGFVFPSGAKEHSFEVQLLKKDQSGFDHSATLSVLPQRGRYSVAPEEASAVILMQDPVVDFSKFLRTAALQGGEGAQVRQAILTKEGVWEGTTTVDLGQSAASSNYLRCYRNLYKHPSFNCMANASVSQFLRMSDLFPLYLYPNEITILDYGNDQGHRQFSPADSVMRFVLDPGETARGKVVLDKPRSFKAYVGSYAAWQAKSGGLNAWVWDSRQTEGNIDASTHEALTGSISVTLERLEGTFDFTSVADMAIYLTAWLRSDSDYFLKADVANGKDPAGLYDITQEDGLWKIQYKMWPR